MHEEITKKIAIDLRVLQIGHQYRGIGAHLINLLNNFNHLKEVSGCRFVFYMNSDQPNPIDELNLDVSNLNFSIIKVKRRETGGSWKRKLQKALVKFNDLLIKGNLGLPKLKDADVFLQLDFNLGIPARRLVRSVLVAYDLIPWVMSEDYLPNYRQRRRKGGSRKASLMSLCNLAMYKFMMKNSVAKAKKLIAISEYTRQDFIKILKVKPSKISTILLAGNLGESSDGRDSASSVRGISYNFFDEPSSTTLDLRNEDFIFWLGGADRRRKLEDLVDAFNKLSSKGRNIKLLLAGFDFASLDSLVTDGISKRAITHSSYKNNIYFLGHISDNEKREIYRSGIACVLPSVYEGFGLTVLEAMSYGCPVITYNNTSISEVAGKAVIFAKGPEDIENGVAKILEDSNFKKALVKSGYKQFNKFSWEDTAKQTLFALLKD